MIRNIHHPMVGVPALCAWSLLKISALPPPAASIRNVLFAFIF